MTNRFFAGVALCAILAGCASSEQATKLDITEGGKRVFDTKTDVTLAISMMGQEMSVDANMGGTGTLTAMEVKPDRVEWSYVVRDMRLQSTNPMTGDEIDSVINVPPQVFTTDPLGRIVTGDDNFGVGQVMGSLFGRGGVQAQVSQFFAPTLARGVKPGESWTVPIGDTSEMEAMSLRFITTGSTVYTYEADVDTLGVKAARVQQLTKNAEIGGEASIQGMSMKMDGEMTTIATLYYSLADGMLLRSRSDTESDIRTSISGQIMPMTVQMTSQLTRK